MQTKELIGKTITDIYEVLTVEVGGLDTSECFIQLDNSFYIDFPFDGKQNIQTITLTENAVSLLSGLLDVPVYHVNKDSKTVGEIADNYQRQKRKLYNRLRKFLFNKDVEISDYNPHKVEYRENKLKNLKDRKIIDFFLVYRRHRERIFSVRQRLFNYSNTSRTTRNRACRIELF
ncbi:MAG TPA: hypothetical protein PLP27_12735 [Crocinitomicaceae bacterium]|nr:hypothetical protein [Crocinitomicaceae bacterium]